LFIGLATALAVAALCGCGATRGQAARTFVRGCRNGVGYGGVTRYSQSHALHTGPLSLGELGALTLASLDPARPGQTRFEALEDVAVLRAGAVVTVAVPQSERSYVGLIYDTSKFRNDGAYRIADLDSAVRFEACRNPHFNHGFSQFDGGVVVAGRRCFTLDFYIRGRRGKLERRLPRHGCD
jgi:hypothetical protein